MARCCAPGAALLQPVHPIGRSRRKGRNNSLEPRQTCQMHDLVSGAHLLWNGARNYVRLDPHRRPAHVLQLRARMLRENDFDYFL